jgi:hypothetical protein
MELREVELASSVPPASGAEIEIELRTGHILRLRGGDEMGPLVSLVRALESA